MFIRIANCRKKSRQGRAPAWSWGCGEVQSLHCRTENPARVPVTSEEEGKLRCDNDIIFTKLSMIAEGVVFLRDL